MSQDILNGWMVFLRKTEGSRSEIEVVIGPYGHKLNPERARQYQDAGVDQLVGLIVGRDLDELERWLDRLAEYI